MDIARYRQGYSVGVGGILVRDRTVLFVRQMGSPLKGKWTLPGGYVEREETLDEAVVREVFEETGLVVSSRGVLAIRQRLAGPTNDVFAVLAVTEEAPQEPTPDGSEVDAVYWFSREDLVARDDIAATARYVAWQVLTNPPHVLRPVQNPYWELAEPYRLFIAPQHMTSHHEGADPPT